MSKVDYQFTFDEALKKAGVTGSHLAKRLLGVHPNYVTNIRRKGEHYDPKLSTLISLATATGRDIHDFFTSTKYEEAKKSGKVATAPVRQIKKTKKSTK